MKVRAAALVLTVSLAASGAAHAQLYTPAFTPGLYTVINYSGAYPDFKKVIGVSTPSYLDGVEADLGWRFNRFYSVEASYSYFTGSKENESLTTTLQTAAIDGLGYLPFGRYSPMALYGDVGGTAYFLNATTTSGGMNQTKFGARVGGGFQYQFDDNLGLRLGGRYEWANLTNMRSAEVFTVGLVWER